MNMNKLLTIAVICIAGTLLTGCNMFPKDDDVQRDWLGREVEIIYGVPSKVVAIWTNSVFNEAGNAPVRGLGGRVYFYDAEHRPVRVEGKLSIFMYDDTTGSLVDVKQEADKVVHFTQEEVEGNFSPSEFGPSYSFWVPWDEVGGDRKQLSVIPVFTDTTGHMLVGEQARHLLPGTEPVEILDEHGEPIMQTSYTERETKNAKVSRMSREEAIDRVVGKSTTIKLPSTMQERLKQSPPRRSQRSWDIRNRTRSSLGERDYSDRPIDQFDAASNVRSGTSGSAAGANPSGNGELGGTTNGDGFALATSEPAQQSSRSELRQHLVPSSPFAQRVSGPSRSLLAPGESLFGR